jgi:hypothetical protein
MLKSGDYTSISTLTKKFLVSLSSITTGLDLADKIANAVIACASRASRDRLCIPSEYFCVHLPHCHFDDDIYTRTIQFLLPTWGPPLSLELH